MKITYCEDYKGNQFFLTNTEDLDKEFYPKQVEFENIPKSQYNDLLDIPIEELKDKIKKVLDAHYPENK